MSISVTDGLARPVAEPNWTARLRVLFLVQSLEGGGAERQIAYLANALSLKEWDVHLALLRLGHNWSRIATERIAIHHLKVRGNYDPSLVTAVWLVIRKLRPDIVLTWLPQMDTLGGLCATIAGVPWILCERTTARAFSGGLRALVRRQVARRASAVIANSEGGAAYWTSGTGLRRTVEVVPNIVPLADIDAEVGAAVENRAATPTDRTVVAVGRLVPLRNYENLIAAWAAVWQSTRVRLTILGDGSERQRLAELVERLKLDEAIEFPGFVSDVFGRMSRAEAYVSLSSIEGHPNATIEAAAVGCPLVLSDIPEHRCLFTSEEAIFAPPSDPPRIAAAVLEALAHPARSRKRAASAQDRVRKAAECDVPETYNRILRRVVIEFRNAG
jgi:glycosyltransferase involved in cell wall biosynthesis